MTKKGYQKRLPTVLPAAVPAPRTSTETHEPTVEQVEQLDGVDEVVEPESATLTPSAPEPRPAPASAPLPRSRYSVLVQVGIALVALLVAAAVNTYFLLADGGPDDRSADPTPGSAEGPGLAPATADESYVETLVEPDGEVVVHQWIRADEPLRRLRLALPEVPGDEELSAEGIEVVADGVVVAGPDQITGRAATYVFPETTGVQLSYRLAGAVERSDSAAGRALAVATSLDVTYEPRPVSETRAVRGPEVLSLACSPSPEEPLVPCGEANGEDQWRVELTGPRVDDRVAAVLNLS